MVNGIHKTKNKVPIVLSNSEEVKDALQDATDKILKGKSDEAADILENSTPDYRCLFFKIQNRECSLKR